MPYPVPPSEGDAGNLAHRGDVHRILNSIEAATVGDLLEVTSKSPPDVRGVGKDTSFGVPMTPSPSHQNGSGAWDAANRAWYYRSEHGGTISGLTIYVATSSGNISLAAYANAGSGQSAAPTGGQTVTTGAIACPAAGRAVVSLGASYSVPPGDWLGMSCDNITAAFYRYEAAGIVELVHGLGGFQGTAHPLPATPAVSWRHGRIWTIAGVA